jgi:xylan 1,4-beta-xylosidase
VEIRHYRVDNGHSNAYRHWIAMGSPNECTPEQLRLLKGKMDLELFEDPLVCATDAGEIEGDFHLPMPGVSMFVVTPVVRQTVAPKAKLSESAKLGA